MAPKINAQRSSNKVTPRAKRTCEFQKKLRLYKRRCDCEPNLQE